MFRPHWSPRKCGNKDFFPLHKGHDVAKEKLSLSLKEVEPVLQRTKQGGRQGGELDSEAMIKLSLGRPSDEYFGLCLEQGPQTQRHVPR